MSNRKKYGLPFTFKMLDASEKSLKIKETIRDTNFFDSFDLYLGIDELIKGYSMIKNTRYGNV